MAARAYPPPPVADDPSTEADAVSLHTIAEQADAYEAQEREDADFALALALEEEEAARFARVQRIINPQGSRTNEPRAAPDPEAFTPYRDDPGAADDTNNLPYRDDPDAEPVEGEQTADAEAAADLPPRQNIILRIFRKIVKAWLCYVICSSIFTVVVIVAVLVLSFLFGGKTQGDPKEAAWLASGSRDHSLNLPRLYPNLEESTSPRCKKTWEDIASSLPCHRMILSSAWDNGNFSEAKAAGADPVYYKDAVCTQECKTAVRNLHTPLSSTCANRINHFELERYGKDGRAYFEKHDVEEGPVDVSKSLWLRYDRLCNGPAKRWLGKTPLSCAEDLWITWGIDHGKNEANLNGLDTFFEQTSVKKTIPGTQQTMVKLNRWGQNLTFTRRPSSRRVGPGQSETQCSSCLTEWLSRKSLSFRFGEILEPGTRTPLGLADFASRMRNASDRCYGHSLHEDRVWEAMGWWCNGAPCRKDDSIPQTVINMLHGHDKTNPPRQPSHSEMENVPRNKKAAARTLATAMESMRCAALDLTPSDLTSPHVTSAHVVSSLCTPRCLNAVDRISTLVEAAKSPQAPFTSITDSIATFRTLCRSSAPVSFTTTPETFCAPGFAALNLTSLITSPPSSSPSNPPLPRASILSTFRTALAPIKYWRSQFYREKIGDDLLKLRIAESPCNTCAGEIFIGQDGRWKETVDAFLKDPEVNGTEYVMAAREGWEICGKMFGVWENRMRKALFEKVGLGDGVGGLPL